MMEGFTAWLLSEPKVDGPLASLVRRATRCAERPEWPGDLPLSDLKGDDSIDHQAVGAALDVFSRLNVFFIEDPNPWGHGDMKPPSPPKMFAPFSERGDNES